MKFVLVALADTADSAGQSWPCTETICCKTSLDRKTVIAAIDRLEQEGFVKDTGDRKGRTGQVKIYQLACGEDCKHPKTGTIPFFPSKAPVFPSKAPVFSVKGSLKRDTEPLEPLGTPKEPSGDARQLMETGLHIEWEALEKWLANAQRNGSDYTRDETRSAWLALEANGWMWGRNRVSDYRAAVERQIQTDRNNRRSPDTRKPNGVSAEQIEKLTRTIQNI